MKTAKLKRLPDNRRLSNPPRPDYPRMAAETKVITRMVHPDPDGPCDVCDGQRQVLSPVLAADWMVTRCPSCRGEEWACLDDPEWGTFRSLF